MAEKTQQEKIIKLYKEAKKNLVKYRFLLLENDPDFEVRMYARDAIKYLTIRDF